jgi:hypothetical protein
VFYLELPQKASMPVSEETLGVYNVLKKALSDALLLD